MPIAVWQTIGQGRTSSVVSKMTQGSFTSDLRAGCSFVVYQAQLSHMVVPLKLLAHR